MTTKKVKSFIKPLDTHTKKELLRFTKAELVDYAKSIVKRNQNQTRMLEDELRTNRKLKNRLSYSEHGAKQLQAQFNNSELNLNSVTNNNVGLRQEAKILRQDAMDTDIELEALNRDLDNTVQDKYETELQLNKCVDRLSMAENTIQRIRIERKELFSLAIKGGKL